MRKAFSSSAAVSITSFCIFSLILPPQIQLQASGTSAFLSGRMVY
ncbi:hypothetical protein MY7_0678 [Bacillus sp. 5B6]|nr:hypothetical protein MY7_0678 [Bacillus sp. 5B6]